LAGVYIEKKDFPSAEKAFLKAIEINPGDQTAMIRLGQLKQNSGNLDGAEMYYKMAAEESLKNTEQSINTEPYIRLALLYEQKGSSGDAIRMYEQVLKFDSRNMVASNNLAFLYAVEEGGKNLDRAVDLAQKAMAAAPENPLIMDTMGLVYYKKGLYPKAIGLLEQSIEKSGANPTVFYHLGLAYREVGDKDKARESLKKALSFDTDFKEKNMARQALQQLG